MSGWRYVRPVSSGGVPVLSIAPLWRRLLASFLNGVVVLGGIGGIAGVVTAGWRLVRRLPAVKRCLRSARLPSRLTGWARPGIDLRPPVRWIRAVWMATVVGAVVGRNWRGPGGRILQVRRVDARTGGSVTVRSALIAFAATAGWKRASARFYASRRGSADERLSALQPTLKELQQAHRDDPDALNRARIVPLAAARVALTAGTRPFVRGGRPRTNGSPELSWSARSNLARWLQRGDRWRTLLGERDRAGPRSPLVTITAP